MTMVLSTGKRLLLEIVVAFVIIALLFVFTLLLRARQAPKVSTLTVCTSGLRLPPGPRGKPILGNVTDMPTHHEWETYTGWANKYGDLVHIKVFGQDLVFVNTLGIARDLFEKRSSIYSDRFDTHMLTLMGWDWGFVVMHYGQFWRRHRKAFHEGFHPIAVTAYHPVELKQIRVLLRRLYQSPEDFLGHLRHLAGAIIMEIVYGIKIRPTADPYIETAEKAMAATAEAAIPGAFLVDTLPILKYVPEWVPGAGFKRKARIWREPITKMNVAPFMAVKDALRTGTAEPSFISSLLEKLSHRTDAPEDEEDVIRNVGSMAYAAGADTSLASLSTFMLAMVLQPDAQRKAQEELDSIIGMNRLPDFDDRENLPYVNAMCKEVQRWHPATPLGIGHRVMQDDVYRDYFIPKGSIIIGNTWAILHNEKLYGPKPEEFRPERFFVPGVKDPSDAGSFGFGRRICPGRHLAQDTMFIMAASILKVFNISPAKDKDGNELPIENLMTSGAISHPEPFCCTIRPRSASAERLLNEYCSDSN